MQEKENRVFIRTDSFHQWKELRVLNTRTGDLLHYNLDMNLGFVFSEYSSNIFTMGWDSVRQFVKERCRDVSTEVDYDAQMAKEKDGMLQWGAWVIQRYITAINLKSRDSRAGQLKNIYAYMARYGMGLEAAEKAICRYHADGIYPEIPKKYKGIIQRMETQAQLEKEGELR